MPRLDWLTARPFAHRGLHDAAAGIIENTAPAFAAAIDGGYGIECDVQVSRDGEAIVYHDVSLGRLTDGTARLAEMSASELRAVPFKASDVRMQTLAELCELVAGRAPLLVEMKSHFDGDFRLVHRVVEVLSAYHGPAAAMSFDPAMVTELRRLAPNLARGIVAERHYHHAEWQRLSYWSKRNMGFLLHARATRPHFVAYSVKDLPSPAPLLARTFGLPLLAWTVRSEGNRQVAARWADQLIFEGWRPL